MELFDNSTQEFITIPSRHIDPIHLQLEHSLMSIAKWESKWHESFFDKEEMTGEQLIDYIRCMTINPQKGDLMQGTGGLRKIRVAFEGRGKSGSARVCYVDFAVYERIYLITAYAKDEKDNLSKAERNEVKKLIHILEATIDRS